MAGKFTNSVNNMFSSIGAMQTLVENFPMNFISLGDLKFTTSFDVLSILFKMLGVDREEIIELITNALTGGIKDREDGSGFLAQAEEIVKIGLELNLINILNCSLNPIISNNLLDYYGDSKNIAKSGDGITLNVSEIDFTGVLNKNPFHENDSKFYFDLEDDDGNPYNASSIYKSKDFNAYLWYIVNKSTKLTPETIWDNRYKAKIYNKKNNKKEILRCSYIDDGYPKSDQILVQIRGGNVNGNNTVNPANYFKTRNLSAGNFNLQLNKTIFEFNHDFITSIKLYEPKVIIAEIVEYLMGTGNVTVNLGLSVNEQIIEGQIQNIIKKVIETSDAELNDCFFSFSNEEYNEMLENSEKNRFNIINNNNFSSDPTKVLNNLTGITNNSTLIEDKTSIKRTLYDLTVTPAKDPQVEENLKLDYDWTFELLRMLAYPLIRPLFTPKVMFLLILNKKIMGNISDSKSIEISDLLGALFNLIKDIIIKLKDLLVEMLVDFILKKIKPLLALFASKLLMETLNVYKSLLEEILEKCLLGWDNQVVGNIDNVNYADISEKTEPNQEIC